MLTPYSHHNHHRHTKSILNICNPNNKNKPLQIHHQPPLCNLPHEVTHILKNYPPPAKKNSSTIPSSATFITSSCPPMTQQHLDNCTNRHNIPKDCITWKVDFSFRSFSTTTSDKEHHGSIGKSRKADTSYIFSTEYPIEYYSFQLRYFCAVNSILLYIIHYALSFPIEKVLLMPHLYYRIKNTLVI